MVKQNEKIIYWIIGAVILVLLLSKLPLIPMFAMVTKVTCQDNTVSYWDLDGNVLDARGIYNGFNHGAVFIPGKLGQAIEFNLTSYVTFPTISGITTMMWINDYSSPGWYFVVNSNGTNYVDGVLDNTKQIITIGPTFGLGFNGSVDEIAVLDRALSPSEISDLYTAPKKICYTVSYEENVSCKDYATEQVTDSGTGCLNYSGDFWPDCEYELLDTQYKIENNLCVRSFYCQEPCDSTTNCYLTNQSCIEDLVYDCYIIENNLCIPKTDYGNCTGTDYYANLTSCQVDLTITAPTIGIPSIGTTPSEETFMDKLNEEAFKIFGFSITLIYLIIALIVISSGIYYYMTYMKK